MFEARRERGARAKTEPEGESARGLASLKRRRGGSGGLRYRVEGEERVAVSGIEATEDEGVPGRSVREEVRKM